MSPPTSDFVSVPILVREAKIRQIYSDAEIGTGLDDSRAHVSRRVICPTRGRPRWVLPNGHSIHDDPQHGAEPWDKLGVGRSQQASCILIEAAGRCAETRQTRTVKSALKPCMISACFVSSCSSMRPMNFVGHCSDLTLPDFLVRLRHIAIGLGFS